jgi:hypothetical protein
VPQLSIETSMEVAPARQVPLKLGCCALATGLLAVNTVAMASAAKRAPAPMPGRSCLMRSGSFTLEAARWRVTTPVK